MRTDKICHTTDYIWFHPGGVAVETKEQEKGKPDGALKFLD